MFVRIYGFDWENYTKRVMPAFQSWLTEGNETLVYQLYENTRCAREEEYLPRAMQSIRTWTRAQIFVQQLPQGSQTRHEYQLLCAADTFTDLSDKYIHRHPPQLYQNSDALRAVWGAIVEEYCQSCFTVPREDPQEEDILYEEHGKEHAANPQTSRGEILSLLTAAGLNELAQNIRQQASLQDMPVSSADDMPDQEKQTASGGIEIGRNPSTLQMRGWLATISVRAMALFELLACGRRRMPFGYRSAEPFEDTIGYLTSDEVKQLAYCLRHAQPPNEILAQDDYALFRLQRQAARQSARLLDEVLPEHAETFIKVIRMASQYRLGLLCSI
jgi:hypothetical protein